MVNLETIRAAKVETCDGAGESYGYFETLEYTYKSDGDSRLEDFSDDYRIFPKVRAALDAYDNGENFNVLIDATEFEAVEVDGDTLAIFLENGVKLFSIIPN